MVMNNRPLNRQISADLFDFPVTDRGALKGAPGEVLGMDADGLNLTFLPAGSGGSPGPAGPANTLTIGLVSEGSANATITGTSPNQVLNLVIPKGDTGPQGAGLIPDAYGNLDETVIAGIEAGGVTYVYVVNPEGDDRSDQSIPPGLTGDQSGKIIGWTSSNGWRSYGQFTGVKGEKGDKGDTGPAPDVSAFLQKGGDKSTGIQVFGKAIRETAVDISVSSIDVSAGAVFRKTVTAAITLSIAGTSTVQDEVMSFILELTNPGVNVTWFPGIKWAGGIAPELTVTGKDILAFYSWDKGITWNGFVLGQDVK